MVDLDKDTVDFVPELRRDTEEPTVLPAPSQPLVNGSSGIAVGMATNIPPHNLGEVIDCVVWAIEHPEATADEKLSAMWRIPARARLPTARDYRRAGHRQAYGTGRGSVVTRARTEIETFKEGRPHVRLSSRDPVPG